MEYKKFKTIIEELQAASKRSQTLYDMGIDLMEFEDPYRKIIDTLLDDIYCEDSIDWIDWYLYERDGISGPNKATDENGKEICHNIKSLYNTVCQTEKYHKLHPEAQSKTQRVSIYDIFPDVKPE